MLGDEKTKQDLQNEIPEEVVYPTWKCTTVELPLFDHPVCWFRHVHLTTNANYGTGH